jgi:hypothetical protein
MRHWTAVIAALVAAVGLGSPAQAVPCANCFAVFLMPDTQWYTADQWPGPEPNDHLDLVTRYICANRIGWTEPSTGKEMPILMVLQAGDMIQGGNVAQVAHQWSVLDAAFDNLDACSPVVPYVLAIGNHETEPRNQYWASTTSFQANFGEGRWASYACADPTDCDWDAGEWFIGGGDTVVANSRNHYDDWEAVVSSPVGIYVPGGTVTWGVDGVGVVQRWKNPTLNFYVTSGADPVALDVVTGQTSGTTATIATTFEEFTGIGPPTNEPGRHRAAAIRAPNGQRWVFMGLEMAFDMDPLVHPSNNDDGIWVKNVFDDYAGAPTVVVHHSLFNFGGGFNNKTNYGAESRFDTEPIWDELVEPYPQILMTFNANGSSTGAREWEGIMTTPLGYDVFGVFRNYAGSPPPNGWGDGAAPAEKDGWFAIAVFDPDAGEIRVRSYRIDDTDADATYDGVPEDTANLDTDFSGKTEVVVSYGFPDTRPASLDNCPGVSNPDQLDTDSDGVGDACDDPCSDGEDNDGDTLVDGADPGCRNADWHTESPECDDGVDNDGDGRIDLLDPQCGNAWQTKESGNNSCGLGFELALLLLPLYRIRRRRRAAR